MKRRVCKVLCTALSLGVFLAAGCGAKTGIVGKWHEVNGTDQIEFTSDGTFAGTMKYGSVLTEVHGTYFTSDNMLSINLGDNRPLTVKWNLSDGFLVLTYENGGAVKYDGSMARFQRSD